MQPNLKFEQLPDRPTIEAVARVLNLKGIPTYIAENSAEAKKKLFQLLPAAAEVMNMTSATLETIGANEEILKSGHYISIRKKIEALNKNLEGKQIRSLGAAPDWAVGSVHALTLNGEFLIASNTGSQLPAYAYSAEKVIWVIGVQKIVEDVAVGLQRIYEYALPMESVRAQKAYGTESAVNKILIINREKIPNRIETILINEKVGF